MKRLLFTFSFVFLASYGMAQETLSLGQCLKMGIERNLNLKTYEGNVLKGKHNISENRSRLLPQINIGAALSDNFDPPVSVTDGSAYGKPYNVTNTLQYNASASVQLQMPLYSQTARTALNIAKTLDVLNTLSYAKAKGADVVIIDTAGRLHNKINLMNELTKIKRVMSRVVESAPQEILLVLDGSTGQNAFEQARQFGAATEVNALAVTKLDGTSKGGVVIGISDQFNIPVKYIGLGEGLEDLQTFHADQFVRSLFGDAI